MTGACDRTDGGNKAALSAEPLGAEPMQPPILRHFADLSVAVARPTVIGDTGTGERRLVAIVGGTVSGSRLTGTILPGGSDDQRIGADGVTHIHARYLIEAEDGALIHVESVGLRSGAPEVMDVVDGACRVKLRGSDDWVAYGAGQSFSVAGDSSFEIEVTQTLHYVCHFG